MRPTRSTKVVLVVVHCHDSVRLSRQIEMIKINEHTMKYKLMLGFFHKTW